jgi:alginate O-acetyltransferase complex protein AlgI
MTEITDNIGGILTPAKPRVSTRGVRLSSARVRRDDVAGRWAPPAAWVAIALLAGSYLPAWAWMWLIAVAVFAACKWATWWPHRFDARATAGRHAGFLFGYAGMDAEDFYLGPPAPAPRAREWIGSAARAVAGAVMIWLVARVLIPFSATAGGWIAMIGLVLLLHFGLLDLLALGWRARGVNAQPLMRRPTHAKSLADFWGKRWNTGFRALAHDFIFEPLRRTLGVTGATAAVFLASGAIHDLVISLPARGGYGLPTLYFAIQFAGLTLERAKTLRRLFARHASLGRAFTIAFVIAPLPLLFHEKFVHNVILPFLNAIGGLS